MTTDDLDLDLRSAAEVYDLPPGDVAGVVRRARRRTGRRRQAIGALATVAVVAGSLTVVRLADTSDDPTQLTAGGAVAQLGDSGFGWEVAEPASALSTVYGQIPGTTDGRYVLSTAPGEAEIDSAVPRVVWRSDDGVDWEPTAPADDLYLSDLAGGDDRLYAVGTAPGTSTVPKLLLGTSDDRADSWSSVELPLDLTEVAARSVATHLTAPQVAVSGDAVVVTARMWAQLDVRASLPAGIAAPDGWARTPGGDGVDILGPVPDDACPEGTTVPEVADRMNVETGEVYGFYCNQVMEGEDVRYAGDKSETPQEAQGVARHLTWAELGVDGDLLRAVLGEPVVFTAPVGSTAFERVELPVDGRSTAVELVAATDGFDLVMVALEGDQSDVVVLHSDDGRSWSPTAPLPADLGYPQGVGLLDGRTALVGSGLSNPAGGMGSPSLAVRHDGGWVTTSLAGLVESAGGKEAFVSSAAIGPLGVVLAIGEFDRDDEGADYQLLSSRDGVTWSPQAVEELISEPVSAVPRILMTADRAVVTVQPHRDRAPGEHVAQVALLGTLR